MDDDFENTLVRDRWVRIMLDFSADGVWDKEGCACDVEDLPVSKDLAMRILAWSEKYDSECRSYEGIDDFDYEASTAEGLSIARAVKQELPDWTIVFFDDVAARQYRFVQGDRNRFEYEIGLDNPSTSTQVGTGKNVL